MPTRSVAESPASFDRGRELTPIVLVHVALLVAGAVSLTLSRPAQGWGVLPRAGAAAAVSTFYLGALVLAHFVVDVAGDHHGLMVTARVSWPAARPPAVSCLQRGVHGSVIGALMACS